MSGVRNLFHKIPQRRRKQLFWLAGLFFAYVMIGFLVLPAIIKWQLVKRLPELTKRQVTVRQVRVNPLTLSLTIRDLSLNEPDGRPFASFDEFYVNFQSSSLFRWAWTFKEIRLVKPSAEVILLKNGELNFANMFPNEAQDMPSSQEPQKPSRIPRINIFHLQLTNGFFAMADQTRRTPFRTEYKPINFVLTDFSTRPDSETPYAFRAESDADRSVSWKGDFSVQPLKSSGELEVLGIRLNHYQPYLEEYTTALLTNGHVDVKFAYSFAAGTNGVDLALTNGAFTLMDLDIRDPRTSEPVTVLGRLGIRNAEMNLRQRTARLGEVAIDNLGLLSRIQQDGHLNFLDLLIPRTTTNTAAIETNTAPAAPWTIVLDHLTLTNTSLAFEDLSKASPFKTLVKPISAELRNVSTASGSQGSYQFHMVTEAREELSGNGKVSVMPPASEGKVDLAGLTLKKYAPYAADVFGGKLKDGTLALEVPYSVALATNGMTGGVSNMLATLANLKISAADNEEDLVNVDRVEVRGVQAELENRQARVGLINAAGGSIVVRQLKDGKLNLQSLMKASATGGDKTQARVADSGTSQEPVSAGGAAPGINSSTPSWAVVLEELNVEGYKIQAEDQKPAHPASFVLNDVALNVKGAGTDLTAPVAAKLKFSIGERGTVDLGVTSRIEPLSAEATIGITNIDLKSLQPYMDEQVALKLNSGLFSTWGAATHNKAGTRFSGDLRIADFACTDAEVLKPFAAWKDLLISGISAEYSGADSTKKLSIRNITWTEPKATLVLNTDGRPNLPKVGTNAAPAQTSIASTQPQGSGAAATQVSAASAKPQALADSQSAAAASSSTPVEIGTVRLEKASLGFSDLSIQPNAVFGVEQLTGTIKGLSSAMNTTAEVNLEGFVGERAPVAISGRVNPLASQLFADLVISNANTQLTPLTGYMEKYAGHALNKGRLTTSLHYVVNGNDLKAENKIQIDQLTLGPRNNSPDATHLPVKLGIALLKDANGRIDLDVPLTGKIDDPEFKLGPIILKVVVNTLVKAATSPFKLLGALVGGGEELSFVQFSPGTNEVAPEELPKLEKLKKALAARPALNVDIEAEVDLTADRQVLAVAKLRDQIKSARIAELTKRGKGPDSAESFQLDPEEYNRILRRMFAEQFGTNIAAIVQSNALAQAARQTNETATASKARRTSGIKGAFQGGFDKLITLAGLGGIGRSPAEKRLTREERQMLDQADPATMEQILADQTVSVSPEEYRALMRARAERVQSWLLNEGGLAADRVLIVAPKPVGEGYKGTRQATFSLN